MLEGLMAVKNNTCNLSTGLLSREQVLQAPLIKRPHSHTAYALTGGGFFDKLKSGFKSAFDFGRKAYDVAKQVSPIVKAAFPMAAAPLGAIGLGRRRVKKMGRGILKQDGTGIYNEFDLKKKLAQSDAEDSEEEY
jgi:hypothetical protein